MGLIGNAQAHEPSLFDAACRRALAIGSPNRKSVLAISPRGFDGVPLADSHEPPPGPSHDNVRGGTCYVPRVRGSAASCTAECPERP
jgi:hypothetical protein